MSSIASRDIRSAATDSIYNLRRTNTFTPSGVASFLNRCFQLAINKGGVNQAELIKHILKKPLGQALAATQDYFSERPKRDLGTLGNFIQLPKAIRSSCIPNYGFRPIALNDSTSDLTKDALISLIESRKNQTRPNLERICEITQKALLSYCGYNSSARTQAAMINNSALQGLIGKLVSKPGLHIGNLTNDEASILSPIKVRGRETIETPLIIFFQEVLSAVIDAKAGNKRRAKEWGLENYDQLLTLINNVRGISIRFPDDQRGWG